VVLGHEPDTPSDEESLDNLYQYTKHKSDTPRAAPVASVFDEPGSGR